MRYIPPDLADRIPFEQGAWAHELGHGARSCPYEAGSPQEEEWLDGYQTHARVVKLNKEIEAAGRRDDL